MSYPGLPPLPKSLSGADGSHRNIPAALNRVAASPTVSTPNSTNRNSIAAPSTLDKQLAILQREMYGLRQIDLSLLSQLWALNESIQEFQAVLQEQETLSPPSPSLSDANSGSSDCDDDIMLSSSSLMTSVMSPQHQHQLPQQPPAEQQIRAQSPPTIPQPNPQPPQPQHSQQHQQQQQRMRGAPPPPPRKIPPRPA